jgi:hypothetical protein
VVGAVVWICGWGALAYVTLHRGWHPRHGGYDAISVALMIVMWGFTALLGPAIVAKYSAWLNVSGELIAARGLFGLTKVDFRRRDITNATLRRKGRRLVLTLTLTNGKFLEVDYWARNFKQLQVYLGLGAPSP